MKLSDYVIDFFARKKINQIFTVSGGGSIFLCDSLQRSKTVQYISCHHEQAVSFAAEGYARQVDGPACGIVTTGPGGTNAITGVASCWIDSVPSIFISGQVFLNQTIKKTGLRQLGVQEIDIISLVKPITKYAYMIKGSEEIRYELEKAYHIATTDRPGPVWIDIPADIQNSNIDIKNIKSFKVIKKRKNYSTLDKKIKDIAKKVINSKKPLFHFGHGVKLSTAEKEVYKFISNHEVPFTLTWNSSDLIESSNKFNMGRPGAFAERGSNFIVQNCDILISVGSRLPFMVTGYNSKDFARNAIRVTVDIDAHEVNKKTIDFQYRLACDANYFLKKLSLYLKNYKNKNKSWLNYCTYIRKKYPIVLKDYKKNKKYVNSYYFVDELSKILPNASTVVTDMGLSFVGTHQTFRVKTKQKLFTNSGHAPMGWGLPAAIGACIGKKNKTVICLTGDGGLQMNIQELATIMHHKLPIKIFIYNNGGYLTIKQTQELGFKGRIMGSDNKSGLSFPNYKKISEAYNLRYFKLTNHKKLKEKLKKMININEGLICEIIMDKSQEQMPKAINRRNDQGKTVPTTFEDMHPFLNKKELLQSTYQYYKHKIEGK